MQLARAVERVVGLELARHGRVGDLLHADGDVHVGRLQRSGRADRGAGHARSCMTVRFLPRPAPPGRDVRYRRAVTATRASTCSSSGAGPGRGRRRRSRPAALGPRRARGRQGPLPPRQDLRRRPHHRRAARARGPRLDVRTLPVVRAGHRDRARVAERAARSSLPLPADGEYAGVVPRVELDAALVDRARDEGVDVRDGVGVDRTSRRDDDASTVDARRRHRRRTRGGSSPPTATTPPCAACSTRTSRARRRRARHVARVPPVLHAASTTAACGCCSSADLLPGYAWVFPRRRRARQRRLRRAARRARGAPSGQARSPRSGATLARRARALRDVLGPRRRARRHRTGPGRSPPRSTAARLAHGRVLFAGDAANVVDPMTGEGIAQALETGVLAARAIARHADAAGASPPGTAATSTARSAPTSGSPALLQHVLRSPARRARRDRAPPALTPWTRRNFARWMFEDYPRAAVLTPAAGSAGMFTGPGAYAGRSRPATSLHSRAWPSPTTGCSTPHWSTDIPLDTPHPRLDALAEHGYVVLRDLDAADPRVGVPRARVHGLEERRRHQLRADRHRRRRARLPRASGSRATSAPTRAAASRRTRRSARRIVAEVESVGADFGRVRVIKLEPQAYDDALRQIHRDDNNRFNPDDRRLGRALVARAHRQPRQLHGPHGAGRRRPARPDHRGARSRCTAARASCVDTQRLWHVVCHTGDAPALRARSPASRAAPRSTPGSTSQLP